MSSDHDVFRDCSKLSRSRDALGAPQLLINHPSAVFAADLGCNATALNSRYLQNV
jgi:hypothetical protein